MNNFVEGLISAGLWTLCVMCWLLMFVAFIALVPVIYSVFSVSLAYVLLVPVLVFLGVALAKLALYFADEAD